MEVQLVIGPRQKTLCLRQTESAVPMDRRALSAPLRTVRGTSTTRRRHCARVAGLPPIDENRGVIRFQLYWPATLRERGRLVWPGPRPVGPSIRWQRRPGAVGAGAQKKGAGQGSGGAVAGGARAFDQWRRQSCAGGSSTKRSTAAPARRRAHRGIFLSPG